MAKTLPVMVLKSFILLPKGESKVELLNELTHDVVVMSENHYHNKVIVLSPIDALEENPKVEDLPTIAVLASITKKITLPNGQERITLVGEKRIKVNRFYNALEHPEILLCDFYTPEIPKVKESEDASIKKELYRLLKKYVKSSPKADNSVLELLEENMNLDDYTDIIANYLDLSATKNYYYMQELNGLKRAQELMNDLVVELQVIRLDQKINHSLEQELEKNQKEYILRERMKELQKELGEEDSKKQRETEAYKHALETLDLPYKTKQKIIREINKYELTNEMSPDISFVRNYLETFFSLPWNDETIEATDLNYILKELNKSHFGLEKVKTRILEYAAMKSRNPLLTSPILCLVGPPGVGKSTIASSIASSLHRSFYKMSVGGLNDSSELTGHRRTYVSSSPGKIISALQKCGSKNPVLLIDEVDKMVRDYKGDPASVLLDILDPNLNQTFTDSYLEEPFDLSHVLFILTANYIQDIPMELRDRLEIIELSSYTTIEKISLAKDYLLPSIYLEYHIESDEIHFSDKVLEYIILYYTKEAGVRDLRRKLETILRKMIMESVKKKENMKKDIEIKDIKKYLEETISIEDLKPKVLSCGLVNGLSVTSIGGQVLPIESTIYDGTGKIVMTGMLGDVMKESLEVVMSYLKTNAKEFSIPEKSFIKKDVHIHVLEASIPKNGPSAGVAITTSLISLFTNQKVSQDIAMTGEMTLRGEILPVGGIKEKVISAFNEGIQTVFIPTGNEIDLKRIPKEVKKQMNIKLVKEYKEIYKEVFR